jgi:succinylarginine dihydrolase
VKKLHTAWEVNFDGLAGTTHNYAGLSYGNVASMRYKGQTANPREAALKGLEKMHLLMALGVRQALIPPQERPHLPTLRKIGFEGPPEVMLSRAAVEAPHLLAAVCSASSMWAANAATVSSSADSLDGKLHVTPANLMTHLHRSIESDFTPQIFRKIFNDPSRFSLHPSLPSWWGLSDEGAANHLRLCRDHSGPGLGVFVYGRSGSNEDSLTSFPRRQTREASQAVARLHGLDQNRTLFFCQNPVLIQKGVFHNDVICVANEQVLFFHESSFKSGNQAIDQIRRSFESGCDADLICIPARRGRGDLSLQQPDCNPARR